MVWLKRCRSLGPGEYSLPLCGTRNKKHLHNLLTCLTVARNSPVKRNAGRTPDSAVHIGDIGFVEMVPAHGRSCCVYVIVKSNTVLSARIRIQFLFNWTKRRINNLRIAGRIIQNLFRNKRWKGGGWKWMLLGSSPSGSRCLIFGFWLLWPKTVDPRLGLSHLLSHCLVHSSTDFAVDGTPPGLLVSCSGSLYWQVTVKKEVVCLNSQSLWTIGNCELFWYSFIQHESFGEFRRCIKAVVSFLLCCLVQSTPLPLNHHFNSNGGKTERHLLCVLVIDGPRVDDRPKMYNVWQQMVSQSSMYRRVAFPKPRDSVLCSWTETSRSSSKSLSCKMLP